MAGLDHSGVGSAAGSIVLGVRLGVCLGSLALDVDALSGRAKRAAVGFRAARRRADAVSRTADAAGNLLDAVSDLGAQHAESDAAPWTSRGESTPHTRPGAIQP